MHGTCVSAVYSVASHVQAIYYLLLMRPSPVLGVLDFYLLVPFSKLFQRRYRVAELTLRDRLGAGNFGQASALLSIFATALPRPAAVTVGTDVCYWQRSECSWRANNRNSLGCCCVHGTSGPFLKVVSVWRMLSGVRGVEEQEWGAQQECKFDARGEEAAAGAQASEFGRRRAALQFPACWHHGAGGPTHLSNFLRRYMALFLHCPCTPGA